MTHRDDPVKPSCPVCTTNDEVTFDRGQWLCGTCWTLFSGDPSEWDRTKPTREFYKKLTAQEARQCPG